MTDMTEKELQESISQIVRKTLRKLDPTIKSKIRDKADERRRLADKEEEDTEYVDDADVRNKSLDKQIRLRRQADRLDNLANGSKTRRNSEREADRKHRAEMDRMDAETLAIKKRTALLNAGKSPLGEMYSVFSDVLNGKISDMIGELKEEVAQELFEKKGEWIEKTAAGGGLSKVTTKGQEKKMERDLKLMGNNVPFKAPEMSALRKKGYVAMFEGDDDMLVSRDTEEGEEPTFSLMKYKAKRDGAFTYLLVFNMPSNDSKKYEIYTDIESIPMFKDAKREWVKTNPKGQ